MLIKLGAEQITSGLFHKDPDMEQLMPGTDPSGAETLECETGIKQPKWNSRRAATAAAGETRGRRRAARTPSAGRVHPI